MYQPGESVELPLSILGRMPAPDAPGEDSGIAERGAWERGNLKNLEVVLPDGARQALAPPQHGVWAFHETYLPGIYEVRAGKQRLYQFSVNLLDPNESDIRLPVRSGGETGLRGPNPFRSVMLTLRPEFGRLWGVVNFGNGSCWRRWWFL